MGLNATQFADPHRRHDPLTSRWVAQRLRAVSTTRHGARAD